MNKDRILELAGMKKAIGRAEIAVLNEMDARTFVRSLPIYRELMKDTRAKPAALQAATSFVKDMGDGPIPRNAQNFIANELTDIASEHNPRGSMMSGDDEEPELDPADAAANADEMPPVSSVEAKFDQKIQAAKRRKAEADRPKQARIPASDALTWLRKNPNASARDFVAVAVEAGMNPKTARAKFYKEKAKLKRRMSVECFILKKGDKILSERSRPLIPHFIDADDFNSEYLVFESKKDADDVKNNFILHVSEDLKIVKLAD